MVPHHRLDYASMANPRVSLSQKHEFDTKCTEIDCCFWFLFFVYSVQTGHIHRRAFSTQTGTSSKKTSLVPPHTTTTKQKQQHAPVTPARPSTPSRSLESTGVEAARVLHRHAANRTGSTLRLLAALEAAGLVAARDEDGLQIDRWHRAVSEGARGGFSPWLALSSSS